MQREIVFDGHGVSVAFCDPVVDEVLDFLFIDLPQNPGTEAQTRLVIEQNEQTGNWRLTREDKPLFTGPSLNGMANILMGEVLFHLIAYNHKRLAIHAGLVSNENGAILMPAHSGGGKSSVTAWLTARGLHYHTDELVLIDSADHSLKAFTRPLNIKSKGVEAIREIIDLDRYAEQVRASQMVTMIPHRLINPEFIADIPPLSTLVFPQYIAESKSEITPLSAAEAGLEMMRSNVIARNLPKHGFDQITKLVRALPAYRLHYSRFGDLPDLFEGIL